MSTPAQTLSFAAVPRRDLHVAAEFCAREYQSDPAFAELFGLDPGVDLSETTPIFHGICQAVAPWPGTTVACYRGERMIGVVTTAPVVKWSISHHLLHPLRVTWRWTRGRWIGWCYRARLDEPARSRLRRYTRQCAAHTPRRLSLRVLQLAVARSEQRRGIARTLLAHAQAHSPWQIGLESLVTDTWHERNVEIYRRLGFEVMAHAEGDPPCWTMTRPISDRG